MKRFSILDGNVYYHRPAFGQKADIDNYWVDISTAILPDNKVAPENRTFSIRINGDADYTGADVTDNVRVFGWKNR